MLRKCMRHPPLIAFRLAVLGMKLIPLFTELYITLLWFFQEGSSGPVVARQASTASCKRGGIVSRRTTAMLLAILVLTSALGSVRVGAQQTQTDEIVRRAKNKVQPIYPDLARKMNLVGT